MITLAELSKDYTGFHSHYERLLCALSIGLYRGGNHFQALKDISFEIRTGEIVGILGRNGAGKSTLLKVLGQNSEYNSGQLQTRGSLRSILELGVGFNPELSGVENVYYNGLVWGYSATEIRTLMPTIFDFADLSGFKNAPLKNYSSGMIMRLGFSLATAKRPDILLIDEALSVGDASFQQKSLQRIFEFQRQGSIIVVVSHDLNLLRTVSQRLLVLEKGQLVYDGPTREGIQRYMQVLAAGAGDYQNNSNQSNAFLEEYSLVLEHNGVQNPAILPLGSRVRIRIKARFHKAVDDLTIGFHIDDSFGRRAFGSNTWLLEQTAKGIQAGNQVEAAFELTLDLAPGEFTLGFALHSGESHTTQCYLWQDNALSFQLERSEQPKFDGYAHLPVSVAVRIN
ncbi:MAG: ABC transporter ATP-binding protein [Leptospiraceae bacterium]|nr:ABC transporter ATP-binding protein [Leptospiraceae bacterium]